MKGLKCVICPDTFKGTLSSRAVCDAIAAGLQSLQPAQTKPSLQVRSVPMSDGGAGLIDCVAAGVPGAEVRTVPDIVGPHGPSHRVRSRFVLDRARRRVIVEMAEASGLPLVEARIRTMEGSQAANDGDGASQCRRDPLIATSFGTGQLLRRIAETVPLEEATDLFIGLGGSATNDGGIGALQALGAGIYVTPTSPTPPGTGTVDDEATPVLLSTPFTGADLGRLARIDTATDAFRQFRARFAAERIHVLCDVTNPLLGPSGATMVYGPQKGPQPHGTPPAVLDVLESGMLHAAMILAQTEAAAEHGFGPGTAGSTARRSLAEVPGSGAAGGMGAALLAQLGALMVPGGDTVQADLLDLRAAFADADVVITGEGCFDAQTVLYGKTVASVFKAVQGPLDPGARCPSSQSQRRRLFLVVCGAASVEPADCRALADCPWLQCSNTSNSAPVGFEYMPLSIRDAGGSNESAVEGMRFIVCPLSPNLFPTQVAMTDTRSCLEQVAKDHLLPLIAQWASQ